jgi:hypothetical protein
MARILLQQAVGLLACVAMAATASSMTNVQKISLGSKDAWKVSNDKISFTVLSVSLRR